MYMLNFIVKISRLYKMFNFTKVGDLIISYGGSKIMLTNKGDIIINAKRHTIHHRTLFLDGCDQSFINEMIKEREKGKEHFEDYINRKNMTTHVNTVCKAKEVV